MWVDSVKSDRLIEKSMYRSIQDVDDPQLESTKRNLVIQFVQWLSNIDVGFNDDIVLSSLTVDKSINDWLLEEIVHHNEFGEHYREELTWYGLTRHSTNNKLLKIVESVLRNGGYTDYFGGNRRHMRLLIRHLRTIRRGQLNTIEQVNEIQDFLDKFIESQPLRSPPPPRTRLRKLENANDELVPSYEKRGREQLLNHFLLVVLDNDKNFINLPNGIMKPFGRQTSFHEYTAPQTWRQIKCKPRQIGTFEIKTECKFAKSGFKKLSPRTDPSRYKVFVRNYTNLYDYIKDL